MDQPGTAHAVPGLSAAHRALLIRSWRNADRPAVYLAVVELIRATSKDELKGLVYDHPKEGHSDLIAIIENRAT